jgi:hypothetical protein
MGQAAVEYYNNSKGRTPFIKIKPVQVKSNEI